MKSRYNSVLVLIIGIGLLFALWLNYQRYEVEKNNNTVEMAMEFEGLKQMADWEGMPFDDVLLKFKNAGVTSLIVFDTTLEKLSNDNELVAVTGEELLKNASIGKNQGIFNTVFLEGNIKPNAVYVAKGKSATLFADVLEDLTLRFGKDRVRIIGSEPGIIEVLGNPKIYYADNYDTKPGVMQSPLGLSVEQMNKAKQVGFNVLVRPQNYLPNSEEKIASIFKRINRSGANVTGYIGTGRDVVGYPEHIEVMAEQLKDHNMYFGMVEHYTQLQYAPVNGNFDLAQAMDYDIARSYVIDRFEQRKIPMQEALRRWALTDEERNIRINYIKPFMIPQAGKDILELNLDYVTKIRDNVRARGYDLGEAGIFGKTADGNFAPYFPNKIYFVPLVFAILAGGILYLSLLFDISNKWQYILLAIAGIICSATILKFNGVLTRQILAFVAAVVFPVLSMTVIVEIWESYKKERKNLLNVIFSATWQLALAIVLSLVGAAFLAAILGDSRFFLELDIYRGVKLTFIMPLILIAIWYEKRFDLFAHGCAGNLATKIKHFLALHINVKNIVVLGFLAFVAYIFVGRSGHTAGIPVPALEIKMRLFLEEVMYARPREKEFLIGHPAFYVAALAAYWHAPRLWQMLFVIGATIGQGSLVQTFAHMRTPVIMSFVRALDGYALGVILGIIAVIVIAFLLPIMQKLQRRYLENE